MNAPLIIYSGLFLWATIIWMYIDIKAQKGEHSSVIEGSKVFNLPVLIFSGFAWARYCSAEAKLRKKVDSENLCKGYEAVLFASALSELICLITHPEFWWIPLIVFVPTWVLLSAQALNLSKHSA